MLPVFPLGVFRDRKAESLENTVPQKTVTSLLGLENPVEDIPSTGLKKESHSDLALKIAGFGGQGVLLLGQIIAEMGMREGREVSWLPSYGPEMRSGSAHCHVCLSNERVGSPLVDHPDVLIAMNELSLHKFVGQVSSHATILYNGTKLPENFPSQHAPIFCIPASEIADSLGTTKVTNMIMLGALLELTHALTKECAIAVLKAKIHNPKLLDLDYKAIDAGMKSLREQLTSHLPEINHQAELLHTR